MSGSDMALTEIQLPDLVQIERRHLQINKDLDELEKQFEHVERQELAAFEAARKSINADSQREREKIVSELGLVSIPESIENLLMTNRGTALDEAKKEYLRGKEERKRRHDQKRLDYFTRHKDTLFAPPSPTLQPEQLPGPQEPVEVQLDGTQSSVQPARVTQAAEAHAQRETLATDKHTVISEVPPVVVAPSLEPTSISANPSDLAPPQHAADVSRRSLFPTISGVPNLDGKIFGGQHAASSPESITVARNPARQPELSEVQPIFQTVLEPAPVAWVRTILPSQKPASVGETSYSDGTLPGRQRLPDAPSVRVVMDSGWSNPPLTLQPRKPLKRSAGDSQGSAKTTPKRAKAEEPAESARSTTPQRPDENRKTITFDEVWQDGNAKYKHTIVTYPPQSTNFYILKCDEHGVHFNTNPLAGAAKHLHSAQHGNMSKEQSQAIEVLGHLVLGCDAGLAAKNNEAVKRAFENGYKAFNYNQLTKTERAGLPALPQQAGSGTTTPRADGSSSFQTSPSDHNWTPNSKPFNGITDPIAGDLYLAYWKKEKRNYAVIVLPWGDLSRAGLPGSSLSTTGLLNRCPKCYLLDRVTGQIKDWARGYENGGPLVTKREFPVMYFDERRSVGWVRARDLSLFHFESSWADVPDYFTDATNYYAHIHGFDSFKHMEIVAGGRHPESGKYVRDLRQVYRTHTEPRQGYSPVQHGQTEASGVSEAVEDQGTGRGDDSDRDSVSKMVTDSDNDVEMTNTESRRTSVSNRGEVQEDPSAKNAAPLAGAQGQYTLPRIEMQAPSRVLSADSTQRVSAASPNAHTQAGPVPGPSTLSLADTAQLIAARALHLRSPEQEVHSPAGSPQDTESPRSTSRSHEPPSRQGSVSSMDQSHRRVEKIYASSNPNRGSKSPGTPSAALPETRPEGGLHGGTAAAQIGLRIPSPASLQNILQSQPGENRGYARPGPLMYQQGFYAELPQVRTVPSQAQQPPPSADISSARSPLAPGAVSPVRSGYRSPLQLPTRLGTSAHPAQVGQPPVEQQQARGSTFTPPNAASNTHSAATIPTVLTGNESSIQDRWRAVRTDPPSSSTGPLPPPPEPAWRYQAAGLPSYTPRPSAEPARDYHRFTSPLGTPSLTATNTRSNSPSQASQTSQTSGSPIKMERPGPSLASEAGERFDVAFFPDAVTPPYQMVKATMFRLIVSCDGLIAATAPGEAVQRSVDPRILKQVVVEQAFGEGGTAVPVRMVLNDRREQTFVFETANAGRGVENGRIHARRFCRWVKKVNPAIDYRNLGFDPNRRLSQASTAVSLD